ncbi:MAG: PepSY domain-containing protein [Lachnospiraceae bacterium]|nr:PepSY domain-containing protein [Lachnospiraceae bacterium]
MKKSNRILTMIFLVCFVFANVLCFPTLVSAKEITSSYQAKRLAREKVKGATVTEVDRDYEKGELVYEVKLVKGKKEYELTYRASDAKLISYKWEIASWYITKGKGKIISKSKCKKLAKKEVSGGSITSLVKKRSDGIDIYKVKMKKGSKKYELEFHARTGKLLEYEWELTTKSSNKNNYIGTAKAKEIALKKVGGGHVIKVEFDMDDGVPVYEVEIIKGDYEYDVEIHAKTGKILEVDKDYIYD